MDKKYLYSGLTLAAIATISYQTWKTMNITNETVTPEIVADVKVENKKIEDVKPSEVKTTGVKSYSVTKAYTVYEDNNSITVNVGLEGNKITLLEISHFDDSDTSKQKHDIFDKDLDRGAILGKDITSLEIATVTGATMTSGAFREAIKDIATNLGS